ncbi:MAG: hypothetical protein HUU06_09615 [Planctomycetaceae bacterium]|nr:hypothetical protein [Planctomycetaceae bacterium]
MPSFPFTASLRLGAEVAPQDARVRTSMDVGPPQMRRRYTAAVQGIRGTLVLTDAQREDLEAFYRDDLDEGVLPFDWDDPRDGSTQSFRFASPPVFRCQTGHSTLSARLWEASLDLEILP